MQLCACKSGTLYALIAFDFVTSPHKKMQQHCITNYIQKKPLPNKDCGGWSSKTVVCCCPSIHTIALLHSSACKLLTRNPVCTGCNFLTPRTQYNPPRTQCNFPSISAIFLAPSAIFLAPSAIFLAPSAPGTWQLNADGALFFICTDTGALCL